MATVTEFLKTLASKGVKLSAAADQLNCYAPNGALTAEVRNGIVRFKPEILALLERREKRQPAPAVRRSSGPPREFPLSAGQKGLYILQKVHPGITAYNLPLCVRISGEIDVDLLEQAWSLTLDRYPILTARITDHDGTPRHQVDERCRTRIERQSIELADEQRLIAFLRQRVRQPFDLDRGPLSRIELITVNDRERILLLTIHHMIFDGVSAVALLRSLLASCQALGEGKAVSISPDQTGYEQFVAWEEAMLASPEGRSHAEYWQQRLSGELPSIELFPDPPRLASASFAGASLFEVLPADLSRRLRDLAREQSLLPSVVFLAAFTLLLHRYTGEDDLIVGMPVNVRPGRKFADEVGYFINMVPLRTRCGGDLRLREFLLQLRKTMLDAIYHSSYPFELMLDTLRTRNSTKNAVFQVNFAYQNFVGDDSFAAIPRPPGLDVQSVPEIGPEGYSDLGLEIFEKQAQFSVHVRYNPDLYVRASIERLCRHYAALLQSMAEDGDRPLDEYSMVPEQEKQKLLIEFNDTEAEYPKDKCIHDFFVEQVALDPGRTAAVFGDRSLTYRELHDRTSTLAIHLQSLGVEPDSVVGLCLERSLEMMIGIIGTVQAGGAYLPLDPDHPDDRLAYMLQDSNVAIVLTQARLGDRVSSLAAPGTAVICLDSDWPEISGTQGVALRREATPRNVCYVIYTSGSTGQPKGALVEHQALVNRIHWMQKQYQLAGRDIVLQKTPYSFDVSVWEFFWPMMTGASLVFAIPDGHKDVHYLERLIDEAGVTTLHFVPSMLRAFLDHAQGRCDSVRQIFASGEALDRDSVDRCRTRFPNAQLHNLYGPTEAAIDVTSFDCSQLAHPFVPIGKPIDNIQLYILDPHRHPQPIGVPGELYIAGDGLARGYLNRRELTEEKFVANPFRPGTRIYKTGDLACWMEDGNIQYLGRIDTQVKIRGFRVEIGEIESRLNQHPRVQDSAIIARGQDADRQLIAFYRAIETTPDHLVSLSNEELRAHLLRTLPDYMVPAAFFSLAEIPLTSSGKVDRRALARMNVTMASGRAYVAPRNRTERQLAEIWAQVLDVAPETIGVNDSFFELGGHSLRAVRLIAKIRSELDVEVPLKAFFDNGSVAQVAGAIASAEKSEVRSIPAADRAQFDRLPLSFAQERLWFINQLEPDSAGYNLPGAVIIRGELDINQIEDAFNLIIGRHENLRTLFPSEHGQAHQRILDRLELKLERIDLTRYTDTDARDHIARQLCRAEAANPFDLAAGPLIRGKVITLAEHEHILMLNMHHIISDGWSIGVLINELRVIMDGFRHRRRPELCPLPIQYADYAVWQRRWLDEGGILAPQLAYWQERLAGVPESLDLATDYPRPGVQSFAGATHAFALDAQLTGRLKRLAEQQGGTLYMVLLAAFKVLLHRYTGQTDICVGSPIANRQHGETEGLIGMFVNTLALRSQVDGGDSFADLLRKVKTTCLEAYEHQDAPFEKVVEAVRPQRNLAISPIFQVMLILQNVDMGTPDQRIERYPVDTGISKFDLTVELTENQEGLTGSIEYSTALYKPQTIARMAGHFTALCRAIITAPTARIGDLDYLGEAEQHRLLVDYNATHAEYPTDRCLHQLFIGQVARHPESTAVICGDACLTYQQLDARSQDLALYLQSQGVEPDGLVGLCMDRSLDMVVGLLAILRAGGAYVPLDPDHPDERLAYMLRDSRAALVLTQARLQDRLSVIPSGTRLIAVDRQSAEIRDRVAELKANQVPIHQHVRPHHLAYVIYTSGSTGDPKGVAIEHHSPVTLACWASEVYSQEELAGVLASTSICFDLSVFEIFVTLANGGTIILVPNALGLVDLPNKESVTLINTVPSAIEELVRLGAIPGSVHTINLAGEPLSRTLVDKLHDTTSVRKVYDLYGPSEDTTYSTYGLRERYAAASIGRPIANTQVYVLDPQHRPQPIGVPGELHLAGDGLARGYLNRPELTRQTFVGNPFQPGTRMYKTGDLARWLDDGTLQYLGRIDTQVKIRGFRIEMGEIEARLNQHPGIQDSAVIAQGEGAGRQLIAFYRAKETHADHVVQLRTDGLRAHLLRTLPDYMVPGVFVSLAAVPLNPNGKVDRRALARIDGAMAAGQEQIAPRNDTERRLVAIWAEVLNRAPETIGVEDSFFEIGGHSLLATQLIAKIRSQLDVDLSLKTLFEQSRVAQLAELIATAGKSETPAIRPVDRAQFDRLPLSFAQERLWFLSQLEPESPGYNLPVAIAIDGELDIDQLDQALNLIIARHENLRTVFPSEEGQAHQRILGRIDFTLERTDLSHHTDKTARDSAARELCRTDAVNPFDLAGGPLIRGKVIRLAEHEHMLMLNMHHIVSDGWSIGVLIKELGVILEAFRRGRDAELAPLPIQYADYGVWQRRWLEEEGILERQLVYWQEKLAGVPESLDLATDYPRPSVQSVAGASHAFALDARLTGQLKRLAEQQGGTLYMALLAAFEVLLHRYTGQRDICVGSPIANRQHGETAGLIGMFVNTLALRTPVAGDDTFVGFLSRVRATCLEAYAHQDAPFEKVVEVVRPQRNRAISPIFQVMLILQNLEIGTPGPRIQPQRLDTGISKFELTFELTESEGGLAGWVEYSTGLYKPQTVVRMVEHFIRLCEAIIAAPAAKLQDLDYLGEAEKRRLLVDFNRTDADYPRAKRIHDFFAEQVALDPTRTAIVFRDQRLSYQELYGRSRDLALYLQKQGVGPDCIVALCLDRSIEMMVGIMGTVLAGGAYMPLDPEHPDDRLAYMLQDSQAAILLTEQKWAERIGALVKGDARTVALDSQWGEILQCQSAELLDEVQPSHLCYVIYTSGSTGKPKGVLNEHGALVNRLNWMQKCYPLTHDDIVLQKTPYSFDVSVWEFFWPMMTGASVVFAAPGGHRDVEYLQQLIDDAKVSTLHYVPSMLSSFLENATGGCESVRQIFCSGEALDKTAVDGYRRRFPNAALHNLYGPTEAAIDVTSFDCSQSTYPFVPIGAPIDNIQIHILDEHNHLQPIGVPGELHIAGDGLARGYLNRPDLTRERFVANPFRPGTRLYKTGDLARWLEDGNIQYLGRIDTQVKIHGFRIELGEIEARLRQHPQIQDSVVVARGEGDNRQLVAFYRATESTADRIVQLPTGELRAHLQRGLPEYMVPAALISLGTIPLSGNGKVDRQALTRTSVTMSSGQAYAAPRNEMETRLLAIWAEVLKVAPEQIGIDDNFFELGGHSLSAVRLMAKTVRHFDRALPLAALFTAPTIASLAELLSSEAIPSCDLLIPIQARGDAPPIFAVPGAGGNVLALQPLARTFGDQQPVFGLPAAGLDGKTQPFNSVEQTARANIRAMRARQPAGPYRLVGYSYGGVVAYEMARILLEDGEAVSSLILLDSIAPSVMRFRDEMTDFVESLRELIDDADLEIDIERLRQSSDEENARHLAGLLKERSLLEIDPGHLAAAMSVSRANLLCYSTYQPTMLSAAIDASLYRATQGLDSGAMPPDYGWSQLLRGAVRIHDVEATHYTILEKWRQAGFAG